MNERELYMIKQEYEMYKYFILKNGSRITSFRVATAKVGDVEKYIKAALEIYPEGAEIYPISLEEHLDIQRLNRERRNVFKRIRKRNTKITPFEGRNTNND